MSIAVYEGPPFASPADVQSAPRGREPVVRVSLPDGGIVEGLAVRWSSTHALVTWAPGPAAERAHVWAPVAWVERIARADARGWIPPHDCPGYFARFVGP